MRTYKIIVPDDFDPETYKVYCEAPLPKDADYPNFPASSDRIDLQVWQPVYREVLDKGHIGLIDFMGSDETIVNAARVSYGRGTKVVSADANLIRYLIRNRHWTPVEMVEVMWHVRAPIFVFRQWHRHRAASINEYSARYSILTDDMYMPDESVMMHQSSTNKQGREGRLSDHNVMACQLQLKSVFDQCAQAYRYLLGITPTPDGALNHRFDLIKDFALKQITWLTKTNPDWSTEKVTEEMIEAKTKEIFEASGLYYTDEEFWGDAGAGLSRELARIGMPLATYSEMYWKADLRNTFNFISLRYDPHAQEEIRVYAKAMMEMLEPIAPIAVAAFAEYVLNGRQFSSMELQVARALYQRYGHMNITEPAAFVEGIMTDLGASKRETREFIQSLEG
jgi:thymidylate synthase (FAD)